MYRCLNAGNIGVTLDWEECLPLAAANGFKGIDVPMTIDTDVGQVRELPAKHELKSGGRGLPFDFRRTEDVFREGHPFSFIHTMEGILDAPDLVGFLLCCPDKADMLISRRFGFGEVQDAFDVFASRKTAKVILQPWE